MIQRLWIKLNCLFRFHDIRVVQELSPMARKCFCRRCGGYFAMNDEFQAFIRWDGDLEHLYSEVLDVGPTLK